MSIKNKDVENQLGKFFEVSGPSGAGKTVLVNQVTGNRLITTTTREPRAGEVHGIDYYFVSTEEFESSIQNDSLLEWAQYGHKDRKHYYGLTKNEYQEKIQKGNVFAVVDVQGKRTYKKLFPDSISIFIYSPFEDVKQQLTDRGGNQHSIDERLSLYADEIAVKDEYDFVIVNHYGRFEETLQQFKTILKNQEKN